MHTADLLHYTARLTFGRETAQFKQLIAFMAAVSIVIWGIVFITMLARLFLCHIWYRRRRLRTSNSFSQS